MTSKIHTLACSLGLIFITGCQAYVPTSTHFVVPLDGKITNEIALEAIIDAGRDAGMPGMTKLDKQNGVVEFGGYGGPILGISAQVRIRSDHQLDVTVARGSAFIGQSANPQADKFKNEIQSHLAQIENTVK